jgi:hypothetical protein
MNECEEFVQRMRGCGVCGGSLVEIRGRRPGEPPRKVCPTCCAERLDIIREYADREYGQTYTDSK